MTQNRILEVLQRTGRFMTSNEIIEQVGGSGSGVRRKLRQLAKYHEIEVDKRMGNPTRFIICRTFMYRIKRK